MLQRHATHHTSHCLHTSCSRSDAHKLEIRAWVRLRLLVLCCVCRTVAGADHHSSDEACHGVACHVHALYHVVWSNVCIMRYPCQCCVVPSSAPVRLLLFSLFSVFRLPLPVPVPVSVPVLCLLSACLVLLLLPVVPSNVRSPR